MDGVFVHFNNVKVFEENFFRVFSVYTKKRKRKKKFRKKKMRIQKCLHLKFYKIFYFTFKLNQKIGEIDTLKILKMCCTIDNKFLRVFFLLLH